MSRELKDYNSIDWNSRFAYNPESKTGLVWNVNTKKCKKGFGAGSIHFDEKKNTKYATVCFNNTNWFAHRVIWIMHNGYLDSEYVIDHIDGNSLNNNLENLRVVEQKLNNRNASHRKDNTSGIVGVSFTTAKKGNNSQGYTYVTSHWYDEIEDTTRSKCKHFSVSKHGLLPSFAMACKFREYKIAELNALGYGYTENHGK